MSQFCSSSSWTGGERGIKSGRGGWLPVKAAAMVVGDGGDAEVKGVEDCGGGRVVSKERDEMRCWHVRNTCIWGSQFCHADSTRNF